VNVVLSIEAVRPPLAGIGRYVWELATRLPHYAEIESLQFLSDGLWRELPKLDLAHDAYENQTSALVEKRNFSSQLRHKLGQVPLVSRTYAKLMPLIAARQLARVKSGVFHGPNFFVPETSLPSVVTIHDLSAYHFGQWHPATRVERMRTLIPQAIARANLVLTDSDATKKELMTEFGISASKVMAVPLGVDTVYHPRSVQQLESISQRFGLQVGGYSFFVSTIEPRKNLLNLIAAYRQLPMSIRQRWPLVLAGAAGWNSQEIHDEIERASNEGWLKYLGFVTQDYLPLLYAGCRLFTYPSSYEGFGLPIAEAMASGVPVVCSNCSSMPEVAGGAAMLVEPGDVDAICLGLERALTDENWRLNAIEKGLARAKQLTWDACVRQTIVAYQMAFQ
jgi:glycosyltransferase involved in cell wall biosynthesis